jgi:hypothetical protein
LDLAFLTFFICIVDLGNEKAVMEDTSRFDYYRVRYYYFFDEFRWKQLPLILANIYGLMAAKVIPIHCGLIFQKQAQSVRIFEKPVHIFDYTQPLESCSGGMRFLFFQPGNGFQEDLDCSCVFRPGLQKPAGLFPPRL